MHLGLQERQGFSACARVAGCCHLARGCSGAEAMGARPLRSHHPQWHRRGKGTAEVRARHRLSGQCRGVVILRRSRTRIPTRPAPTRSTSAATPAPSSWSHRLRHDDRDEASARTLHCRPRLRCTPTPCLGTHHSQTRAHHHATPSWQPHREGLRRISAANIANANGVAFASWARSGGDPSLPSDIVPPAGPRRAEALCLFTPQSPSWPARCRRLRTRAPWPAMRRRQRSGQENPVRDAADCHFGIGFRKRTQQVAGQQQAGGLSGALVSARRQQPQQDGRVDHELRLRIQDPGCPRDAAAGGINTRSTAASTPNAQRRGSRQAILLHASLQCGRTEQRHRGHRDRDGVKRSVIRSPAR